MRSRVTRQRTASGALVAVLVFAAAACSHVRAATGTTRDRAACAQLAHAYASFNAWNGGLPPSVAYQTVVAAAKQADNRQLGTAIASWVGAMSKPSGAKRATGAPYATSECRQIGSPLTFGSAAQSPSVISTPAPTDARTSTTGKGGGDEGDGGDGGD